MKTKLFLLTLAFLLFAGVTPALAIDATLLNYFGNEIDVTPGLNFYTGRGLPGSSIVLWGYKITGYELTSHIKNPKVQVLAYIVCDSPYGHRRLWVANHKEPGSLAFFKTFYRPFIGSPESGAECWVEAWLHNTGVKTHIGGYEWQVNIETMVD